MMLGDLVSLHSKLLCLKCYTALKLKVAFFFSRQYVGQDYSHKKTAAGKVTLDQIDSVSVWFNIFHTLLSEQIPWNLH